MGMNVGNCPRCGKIYVLSLREVCPDCYKEFDLMYDKCFKYLREHRQATMHELSEATEVPVPQIRKFIREGRISIVGNPNMTYPCEVCGTPIREKNMCDHCRQKLIKDVSNSIEDRNREEGLRKEENKAGFKISDRLNLK